MYLSYNVILYGSTYLKRQLYILSIHTNYNHFKLGSLDSVVLVTVFQVLCPSDYLFLQKHEPWEKINDKRGKKSTNRLKNFAGDIQNMNESKINLDS